MTDWTDADGNPLGHWQPCTAADFDAVDLTSMTVFASRTVVGDKQPDGTFRGRDIYTEWGRPGDPTPLVYCHDRWDGWGERRHEHGRFVAVEEAINE